MKAREDCYPCLERLTHQAAELAAGGDLDIKATALVAGLRVLKNDFSTDAVSIKVATRIHEAIRRSTGNPDPYRQMKDREMALARDYCRQAIMDCDDFYSCLIHAARGNTLDFFRPPEEIISDMAKAVLFAVDDSAKLESKLREAKYVLYLADNAGEPFFDLPLLTWMRRRARVIYVVKGSPVQNDVTVEDLDRWGLDMGEVMTTGAATPGIDFALASGEFKTVFDLADFIFAKGMGYYETLSGLPARGRMFCCLMAKCQPVADSLEVPIRSFVAKMH